MDSANKLQILLPKSLQGAHLKEMLLLQRWKRRKGHLSSRLREESEKTKADVKAQKKAGFEAKLKQMEEQLEKKRAEYGEKMKNKVAVIHKEAAEKKATVEAQRAEQILKAEETAAKYQATGQIPKKLLGCF